MLHADEGLYCWRLGLKWALQPLFCGLTEGLADNLKSGLRLSHLPTTWPFGNYPCSALAMTYQGIQQSFYTKFFAHGVTRTYVPDLHLQVVLKMHMCTYVDWSEDCLRAWHCQSMWLSWTPSLCKGKEHACGKRSKALWNFCSVPRGKTVAEFCVNCRSVSPNLEYSGDGVVFIHKCASTFVDSSLWDFAAVCDFAIEKTWPHFCFVFVCAV